MSRVPDSDKPVVRPQTTDENVDPCGKPAPAVSSARSEESSPVERQLANLAFVHELTDHIAIGSQQRCGTGVHGHLLGHRASGCNVASTRAR